MSWDITVEHEEDLNEIIRIVNNLELSDLYNMARILGAPEKCDECGTTLWDMVNMYKKVPTEDLTFRVYRKEKYILQSASGGGDCRLMKNACRSAICSLVLGFYKDTQYYGRGNSFKGCITIS